MAVTIGVTSAQQAPTERLQYLQFRNFDLKGVSPDIKNQLRKVAYNIGMGLEDYQILIGGQTIQGSDSISLKEVRLRIAPITWRGGLSRGYYLEGVLIDKNTGETLNHIKRARIQEHQLVFTASQILSGLFGPREALLEPLADFDYEDGAAPTNDLNENPKNDPDPKKEQQKRENEESETEPPTELAEPEKEPPPNEEDDSEPSAEIREREVTISDFSSPDIDLTRGENPIRSNTTPWDLVHSFDIGLSVSRENIDSTNIIEVSNQITNSGLSAVHYMNLDGTNSNKIRSRLSLSRPISKTEYKFKPRIIVGSYYHLSRFTRLFQPFAGLSLNSSSFVNLEGRGEGLRHFTTLALWYEGGIMIDLADLNLGTQIILSMGKTFTAESNYTAKDSSLALEGTLTTISLNQNIWKMFNLYYEFRNYNFTSLALQSFENTYQEQLIGVMARF